MCALPYPFTLTTRKQLASLFPHTAHAILIYCSCVATPTFTGNTGTGEHEEGSQTGNCKLPDQLYDL